MFFLDVWRVYIGLKDSNTAPKLAQTVALQWWYFFYFKGQYLYLKNALVLIVGVGSSPTPPSVKRGNAENARKWIKNI
jgi:hypothetical protein